MEKSIGPTTEYGGKPECTGARAEVWIHIEK